MAVIPSWQSFTVLIVLAVLAHVLIHAIAHRLWRQSPGLSHPSRLSRTLCARHTLATMAGLCALLFVALTTALLDGDAINAFDVYIRTWMQHLHADAFVQLCLFITATADFATVTLITLVVAALLWLQAQRRVLAGLAISVIGAQATTYIAKYVIARPRPPLEPFIGAGTPSFPSGHTTAAVAAYGFIVYLICRQLPRGRLRFEIAFWGTAFILLIAATRIILGVHYASDVGAGLLVGAFWLLMGYAVCNRRNL